MKLSEPKTEGGFTFADVREDDGAYVGRIVESAGTWAPNADLLPRTGTLRWDSYAAAKTFIENGDSP